MSIWATFSEFDDFEGTYPQPFHYSASHIMPTPGDDRTGSLDLASIPGFVTHDGWCVHGHDHSEDEGEFGIASCCEPPDRLPAVWPWLRLWLEDAGGNAAVVLDRSQVIALRDELTGWIGRTLDGDPATSTPEGRKPR